MQLHGDEGIEACADCGVPALRVVHVPASGADGGADSSKLRAESIIGQLPPNFAAGVVLDTTVKGVQGEFFCLLRCVLSLVGVVLITTAGFEHHCQPLQSGTHGFEDQPISFFFCLGVFFHR